MDFATPEKVAPDTAWQAYMDLIAFGWSVAELASLTPAEWFVVAALAGDR